MREPRSVAYAMGLLDAAGVAASVDGGPDPHPLPDWAASGAMALTGRAGGPGLPAPGWVAAHLRGAALALAALSERAGHRIDLDGPALLGERAALTGLQRGGTVSAGGHCRLLPAADGWVAVSLARPDDVALVAPWLGEEPAGEPWQVVARRVAASPAETMVASAQELGIPAAVVREMPGAAVEAPWTTHRLGETAAPPHRPLVLDLSSLWAGPLCGQLLVEAGCRVVKLESTTRPDGTRRGPRAFFDLVNGGKESVALDLGTPDGQSALARLVEAADVVIEASRPRALEQLGIDPIAIVGRRPGQVWVSITGYGRDGPRRNWSAFGDDAAVAGGLVARDPAGPGPVFCADAAADPVAGLHAAVAALGALHGGGGVLVDVAMRDVVAFLLDAGPPVPPWRGGEVEVAAPRARPVTRPGPALGEHTEAVLAELAG